MEARPPPDGPRGLALEWVTQPWSTRGAFEPIAFQTYTLP